MSTVQVEKKPLNEYQLFVNDTVAELKTDEENDGKKYMELRALANIAWRVLHPIDPTKAPRKPRAKAAKGEPAAAKGEKQPKGEPKAIKVKRAPTAYNMFISCALKELKDEYAGMVDKPNQRDMMSLAAGKWRAYKEDAEA